MLDVLERCEKHPGKALKLVCGDHDQLCCHVCVAVDHRHCSSIQHISEVAKGIRKDPEFRQLPQRVAVLRKHIEDMKNDRKKNSASLRKTRTAFVAEINAIREKINGILDKMETTTVQELDRLVADQELSIKKDMESCTQMHDELKSIMDDIQRKDSSGEPPIYIGRQQHKVKLLDQEYRVVDHCDVPEYPYDVCHIGGNEVAVCVNNNKDNGTALYVYTMEGEVVKKLYEDKIGEYTVLRIALSNDGKTIYITNKSNNQLITLDNLGNKLATFIDPDLRRPYGVHATTAGYVFVCY
ncbi:uncharacterized protein LOC128216209 [Mya arenaria]|uniref:uncharacterized protein LOC128216209 n=1 Tax=Mya arenaria TaxID=6604 RepID=UPI0022E81533|nr:uncharacterized protein LOC128216209 [Mya arenaria]